MRFTELAGRLGGELSHPNVPGVYKLPTLWRADIESATGAGAELRVVGGGGVMFTVSVDEGTACLFATDVRDNQLVNGMLTLPRPQQRN